jgi:ATP-binding cassette subfamily B (MDR/TAP) protein 7
LDSITEFNILEALKNASRDRTSIWIAHRLSTVMDADEILVLEGGRVVDKGSHKDLIDRKSQLYYSLWVTQQHQY